MLITTNIIPYEYITYYLLNKGTVSVFSSDSLCKEDGNGFLKSICLIKYELDIKVYNYENYLYFNFGFSRPAC